MSLRTRLACAFVLVGVVVSGLVGLLSYRAASDRIYSALDQSLRATTTAVVAGQVEILAVTTDPGPGRGRGPAPRYGETFYVGQLVDTNGTTTSLGGRAVVLPVTPPAASVAGSATGRTDTSEVAVGRDAYRVLTTALGDGRALQVGVNIDEARTVLGQMATRIAGVSVAVLLAAAVAGWLLATQITRRLVRLAGVAEDVSRTGRLDRSVPVEGRDEVGRLAAAFTTMLDRLAGAREAQDRLVQDAAHELRTPLTSLRTNASVLRRLDELSPDARVRLVADVQSETRELSRLVEELVELALARHEDEPESDVDLGVVAEQAADRVRRRSGREIRISRAPGTQVVGRPHGLERAVGNLLENAVKFDDGGGPIDVAVGDGAVWVRDRGPGIAAADAERVFDRFYRADAARALPGSGLGLAIVRDVAVRHGGAVFAGPRDGGGAEVGFTVHPGRVLR
ncbi:HAMP domain-containing sensor histidine kinase [Pseudonocardia ailaonensis]|uniref:histidine kinase n=1 Tax=Pseudonocardia ailaonensis TaxID=367279 RepID=A0ABN2MWY9_9PSEU